MSRKQADLIFSIVIFGLSAWGLWQAQGWNARAKLFPVAVAIPMVALGVLQMILAIRNLRAEAPLVHAIVPSPGTPEAGIRSEDSVPTGSESVIAGAVAAAFGAGSLVEEEENIPPEIVRARTREMVSWVIGISVAILLFGFELGSALISLIFLRFGARESLKMSIGIAIATYLFFYLIFDLALNIPFPNGLVADIFGLKALDHYLVDPIASFFQNR